MNRPLVRLNSVARMPTLVRRATSATATAGADAKATKPREEPVAVFSGIQPTGIPHLGNYLGALRQWAEIQKTSPASASLTFCIVDLHAITQPQWAAELRQRKIEMLATMLAIGLDPRRCTIFEQSKVPAHSELMWILACIASMGKLSRMTQWKSRLGAPTDQDSLDGASALKLGLFAYPVLQAADILLHRATHVPVGEDQAQHLELTRELAARFNLYASGVFPLPVTLISPAKRVMSLTDPTQKMSKSNPDARSRIALTDSPKDINAKFRRAITDSITGPITYDRERRPGVSNLIEIYAHMQRRLDFDKVAQECADMDMKTFKETVADSVSAHLGPIREEYAKIMKEENREVLRFVAAEGAKKARERAEATMAYVRAAVGL